MKKFFYVMLIHTSHLLWAQQVAITIDDFPFRRMGLPKKDESEMIEKLYDHLDRFGIKATGFLNSGRLKPENENGLRDFLKRGHKFGNHTHRHLNIDKVGANIFIADIDSGWVNGKNYINTNYFRYPYLRRGNTLERRDSVYAHLNKNGYTIAPISIDNNEWIYNRDYVKAKSTGMNEKMDSISKAYLAHMQEASLKYEKKAKKFTGRSVKHILLLHANPINAEFLGDLFKWYQEQGWEFITLEEALKDSIYSIKDEFASSYGWSQIDRMEKSAKDPFSLPTDK